MEIKNCVAIRTESGRPSRSKYMRGSIVEIAGDRALVNFLHISGCTERSWIDIKNLAKIKSV